MLERERSRPRLYEALAEIHELYATSLVNEKKSAAEEIAKGLAMADKALALNPRMAAAHAVKGSLYLLGARSAKDPKEARAMALKSKEALAAALRENALIIRDRRPIIEAADRMLEASSD
jgi:serine/threonine-protein kinase